MSRIMTKTTALTVGCITILLILESAPCSANDELKKQMRVINGATMFGSAACLSQFDEEKDFNNSSFAKPFKYGNMALQIGIGAALLKDGLGK